MIGFFDYTVWLTYASLLSAVIGIYVSFSGGGHPFIATVFLLFSGLCDAFDGKVARTKPNRTQMERNYGIQIDSLSDLVAFGVLPTCIGGALYRVSTHLPNSLMTCIPYPVYVGIFCIYILAALVRLAYFNVTEEENQAKGQLVRKVYTGLPVTSSALIFPTFLLISYLLPRDIAVGYFAVMLLTAFLFVSKISVRKPGFRGIMIMVGFGVIEFALILLLKFLVPRPM